MAAPPSPLWFPKGEIYNLLTTRPEDLKNEQRA